MFACLFNTDIYQLSLTLNQFLTSIIQNYLYINLQLHLLEFLC